MFKEILDMLINISPVVVKGNSNLHMVSFGSSRIDKKIKHTINS